MIYFFFLEQSLDLLKQKDDVIGELIEGLEKLLIKSSNETFNNSNDLIKLNKVAKNKIKFLNEAHNKHVLLLTVRKKILQFYI